MSFHCPSVSTGASVFTHEPCSMKACTYWKGRCTARLDIREDAAKLAKPVKRIPKCALADICRWNMEAKRDGHMACEVRLLGMVCEHQGGEWNTFEMAPYEEWDG